MKSETYLAGLSSTKQQHLDLILREHAVALKLVLDLIVAYIHTKSTVASVFQVSVKAKQRYARALASSSMMFD